MTSNERIAKAHRAQSAWEEFVGPMIETMRSEYTSRMVEVASQELNSHTRADKITALSNAIRILDTLEAGMKAQVFDGELAQREKIKADNIAHMTDAKKRLLNIAGY